MKKQKYEPHFYVLNYSFNDKRVEMFDIFRNWKVAESVEREVKKYLKNPAKYKHEKFMNDKVLTGYDAIVEEIDSIIKWQEWSRCEYEISVGNAFEEDLNKYEKWDCYQQAHANIDLITKLCIACYMKK